MRTLLALAAAALAAASCGRAGDVPARLTVQVVSTGWRDAGGGAGRNKIVPSASIKVANVSDRTLRSVQVNAVFHRVGDTAPWGSAFVTASRASGMTAGDTATVTLNSERGYTGEDPEDVLLTNTQFVDVTVDLFAKYGSEQWTRLAAFPIDRQFVR
jgi:hypothetical protein